MKKVFDFVENSLAVTTVVAITAVSSFLVLSLTPRADGFSDTSVSSEFNEGEFVELSQTDKSEFIVEPLYSVERHEFLFDESNNIFKISPRSLDGKLTSKLAIIRNNSAKPIRYKVDNLIKGRILDHFSLNLISGTNSYTLYNPQQGGQEVFLFIPANSSQELSLELDTTSRINFQFLVQIELE